MRLLRVEVERALRRRIVWALLLVALLGIVLVGAIAFFDSRDLDVAALRRLGQTHPAIATDWWVSGTPDGALSITTIFLAMGGLIGGAGVVGGEWRSGTVASVLVWEPRRTRLLAARLGAVAMCSFAIGVALQVLYLAALLPAVIVNGTASGVDGAYVLGVAGAIVRIGLLTAIAASVGAVLASIGRNTTAAIVIMWVWVSIAEAILRARKPWLSAYLIGESAARVMTWTDLGRGAPSQAPAVALALLSGYAFAMAVVAFWVFSRHDAVAS